jgi:hypothetical protein
VENPNTAYCRNENPLQHGGTSQDERAVPGLREDYVRLDEQSVADLLQYARRYAERVEHYDLREVLTGDWSPFFDSDVSIRIAALIQNRPAEYEAAFATLREGAESQLRALYGAADGSGNLPPAVWSELSTEIPAFKQLFDLIVSLLLHLDGQLAGLPETGLRDYAAGLLQRDGRRLLKRLLGLQKYAEATGLSYYDATQRQPQALPADVRPRFFQDLLRDGLRTKGWLPAGVALTDYYAGITATDFAVAYGETPTTNEPDKLEAHLQPAIDQLAGIFAQLNKLLAALGKEAPTYLEETLTNWPHHEPHMALFLAFLQLFRIAQDHLNSLRDKHFHYYIQEVLRLQPRPAQPAEVHLLVELAKQVENHILPAGTALKAGKDPQGKALQFTLPEDSSFDKAQVAAVQSVYHTPTDGNLYTAAVTNSEDGAGAALESTDGRWEPFGPVTRFRGAVDDPAPAVPRYTGSDAVQQETFTTVSKPASCGFSIASPTLFLREGLRYLLATFDTAVFDPANPVDTAAWTAANFRYRLTTEEGWYEVTPNTKPFYDSGKLLFFIELPPEAPAILPYQAALHGGALRTDAPVWQILVGPDGSGASPYGELRKLKITKVTINVLVFGVRQLQVYNDFGPVDPSKEFMPFGPQPERGSKLRIGSAEAFQKTGWLGTVLYLDRAGLDTASDPYIPDVNPVRVMARKVDGGNASAAINLLNFGATNIAAASNLFLNANYGRSALGDTRYTDLPPYDVKIQEGYLVLELQSDLGHVSYPKYLAQAALLQVVKKADRSTTEVGALNQNFQVTGDSKAIAFPDPPYTPTLRGLALSYGAMSEFTVDDGDQTAFAERTEQFFHSYPLGDREEHALLRGGADVPLLPQFANEGETYLGLSNSLPRTVVNLLIQVAEGSANPLREIEPVEWAYLHDNHWRAFPTGEVVDGTEGLLQSGLVRITLPRKISADNTWLPAGYRWLRFSVSEHVDAVCDLLKVATQATRAAFADQDNDLRFLANPVAAGTIAKLQQPRSQVKKIEQPFASFDGKPPEDFAPFRQRVSERLRHKDRAITIWDYEHLVLEEFSETYRVKCLNHTRLIADPQDESRLLEDEVAPGHVLVVAVPDQRQREAIDPLRPYTDLGTLKRIGDELRQRISPHVQLDVRNPVFEPIQLDFSVRFLAGRDPIQYTKVLNQALIEYLSPWAYDSEAPITFGGRIHKSSVLDFVEELPYVDYVLYFKMHQSPDDEQRKKMDIETAVAQTGRSILVSHHKHKIGEADDCE